MYSCFFDICIGYIDYSSGPYNVTFFSGTNSSSFDIAILNDRIIEGNEQFYLTINSATLTDGIVLGNLGAIVITIVDDDSK